MGRSVSSRKIVSFTLGSILIVLFAAFAALNAFSLKFLNPATTGEIVVFTGLSALAFLLFVTVLVLLVRNVLKLYADQRSRVMGTRLRTRMLWGAVLVSLVPIIFMAHLQLRPDEPRRRPLVLPAGHRDARRLQPHGAAARPVHLGQRARGSGVDRGLACRIGEYFAGGKGEPERAGPGRHRPGSCASTRSPSRTALPSSTAKAAPSPPSRCHRPPALP